MSQSFSGTRVPPQSLDSEKALLGSVMLKPDVLNDIMDRVIVESFYAEKHRRIFQTMIELYGNGDPIDLLTLTNRLDEKQQLDAAGGSSYLAELVNTVPSAANAKYYAEIVQRKYMMRSLIDASEFIAEIGYDEETELEELLDKAEKKIYDVTDTPTLHKFTSMRESLGEAWERLDKLHNSTNEIRGIHTGYGAMDNILAGFQKSDLIILAARPSLGKTSLALDIARQSAIQHGTRIGIFSLEMSAQQLVDRMLAAEAKVDAWKLRTGRLKDDQDFENLRTALDKLSGAPIFIDDQPSNNILKMRSVARRLKSEHGLDMLIVDYLQLMAPSHARGSDSLVQQVTEISRSLKQLARELDVPVLALSQLSRAVEQRRDKPRLSDLRDSGCLTGDTRIVDRTTGVVTTIRALAERTRQSCMQVHAVDDRYRVSGHSLVKAFYSGRKYVYRLTTRSGRSVKASANHPFLKLDGWHRLDELAVGDRIAVPRRCAVSAPVNQLSEDEATLLAHLVGDGCILPKQPYHYTNAYEENIETVRSAAWRLFGIEAKTVRQGNWQHLYLPSPYQLTHGRRHPITEWYTRLGLERARSFAKQLPAALFRCSEERIAHFLRHLWATDGHLGWKYLRGRAPAASIYYATSSEVLAQQLQHLLLRLGIQSTLRSKTAKQGYRPMHHVHIEDPKAQVQFLDRVGIADRRAEHIADLRDAITVTTRNTNVDTVPREVWQHIVVPAKDAAGMSWRHVQARRGKAYNGSALLKTTVGRERFAEIGSVLQSQACADLATADVTWDSIVTIEPLGYEDVYDATVPGVHNFVANDIIVHNSIEQDADVVMFLHRDDRINENSERPNIVDILIEKHRNGPVGAVELYFDNKKTSFLSVEKSDFSDLEPAASESEEF